MSYEVIVVPMAQHDIDGIVGWLAERSPEGAAAWFSRCQLAIDELAVIADHCHLCPEGEQTGREIRELIFKTKRGNKYRLLFAIHGQSVFVLHVRGPGQDLLDPDDLREP